ncbi:histone-like nucleoid-structuring protein Lsr2 [Streptomyces sp. NPDC046909]|uniref:WhiB family transcriptional regulator n=1 Tax=Streptomyces sp. NPDC046909 TaxID=3155617 RepID=UPI0033F12DC9
MTTIMQPGDAWQTHAACGSADTDSFFTADPTTAREFCGGCLVQPECLYDALDADAPNGIWGGRTLKERRALPVLPSSRTKALAILRELLDGSGTTPVPAEATASTDTTTQPEALVLVPGPGGRYTPEQRAEYERRTVELLKAGASYSEIKRQVGISAPTIARVRKEAGLGPSGLTGGHPARTKAEALAAGIEPYGDGHARWTGPMAGRMPQLSAESRQLNARHVAFELHHGRPPVGRVRSNCGVTTCMAGAHLIDTVLGDTPVAEEEPVTVQALKDLLAEIDEQGGPQAARDNRLHLPSERTPELMTTATAPSPAPSTADDAPPTATAEEHLEPLPQATAEALPVDALLKWGDEHPDPDVQDQAARARAALASLRTRYAANQELTEIASEIEQLEKQLAELRAREAVLTPARKKPATRSKTKQKARPSARGHDTASVRVWAAANGVDCPRFGRIPGPVLDAWQKATGQTGGASS